MGLGDGPRWQDEYEWVRLADLPDAPEDVLGRLLVSAVLDLPVWEGPAARVLLVDLDNLRAEPARLRTRLAPVVALARQSHHVVLAGQAGAVERSRPWLAEYAPAALSVAAGHDEADWALLDAAAALDADPVQYLVVSNDGIFSDLAARGPLTVLSPGAEALSGRLRDVAELVVDLAELERQVATAARAGAAGRQALPTSVPADGA